MLFAMALMQPASAIIDAQYDFEHDVVGNQPYNMYAISGVGSGNVTVVNTSVLFGNKSILFNETNTSQTLDLKYSTSYKTGITPNYLPNGTLNFSFNATTNSSVARRFDIYIKDSTNSILIYLKFQSSTIQYHNGTAYTTLTALTYNVTHNVSLTWNNTNFSFTYDGALLSTGNKFYSSMTGGGIYIFEINSAGGSQTVYLDNIIFNDPTLPNQNPIVRKFPYPYVSALSISSDIDNTNNSELYDYMDYLNTNKYISNLSSYGLNLETSQNFWMKERPLYQPTYYDYNNTVGDYWTTTKISPYKDVFLDYAKSGYYDGFHSIDFTCPNMSIPSQKNFLSDELNILNNNGIGISYILNHGGTALNCNIGVTNPLLLGDNPENSTYYHLNLTSSQQPIIFYWEGEYITRDMSIPYPMNPQVLNDSSIMYKFKRISTVPNLNRNFSIQINDSNLQQLIREYGYAIVSIHLGYDYNNPGDGAFNDTMIPVFDANAISNLSNLNNYNKVTKEIYVTSVAKILKYAEAYEYLNFTYDGTYLNITNVSSPVRSYVPTVADLQGITFYVPVKAYVYIGSTNVTSSMIQNPADYTGAVSIMFPLTTMTYPYPKISTVGGYSINSTGDVLWNRTSTRPSLSQAVNISLLPTADSVNITIINYTVNGEQIINVSSATHNNPTLFIWGDKPPNTLINVKKNGVNWNKFTSNSTGYITFNYTDGYSDIQFDAVLDSSLVSGTIPHFQNTFYSGVDIIYGFLAVIVVAYLGFIAVSFVLSIVNHTPIDFSIIMTASAAVGIFVAVFMIALFIVNVTAGLP